ncbi:MAG: ribosomal RNA small subunit methyltransferase A [Chloroflexi bacterium]|nr:ribosomal RNA small subunit methyltransferase A [Chloroflexota bacterium]
MPGSASALPPPSVLLRRFGLRPRKRWSQSFLTDARVLESIVQAAKLEPTDEVLEVGPGLGALTARLAPRVRRVVAVEIDPALVAALGQVLQAPNLTLVCADILGFDPGVYFPGPYKLVANLPYHVTSPTLMRFLVEIRPPTLMVVTIQREVGERIVARPGEMSYLSAAVQLLADVELVRRVPASAFYPPPKVESAVLRLRVLAQPRVPVDDVGAFLRLVQAGFAQPRKQLANSLAQGLEWPKDRALAALEQAGVAPTRRPQELSLEEWRRVYQAVGARAA